MPAGQRFVAVGVEPYAEVSGVLHFRHVRFGNGERYVADRAVGSLSAALDLLRRESDPDRNVRRVRDDQVHVEIQRQGVGHLAVDFDRAAGEQVIDQIRVERFVDRLVGPPVKVGGGSERDLDRVGDPGEISRVQIRINGSQDAVFRDKIPLNTVFERNFEYMEGGEKN